jgi:hypothetical protein
MVGTFSSAFKHVKGDEMRGHKGKKIGTESRAGHVGTVPSEVNDRNGRRE